MIAQKLKNLVIPESVDVSSGSAPIAISGSIFPNEKISQLVIWFDQLISYAFVIGSAELNYKAYTFIGNYGTVDSWSDGISSQIYQINRYNNPGIYNIQKITTTDALGQIDTYYPKDLAALGINTSINIIGATLDETDSILKDLRFPALIDLTNGGAQYEVTCSASDLSGISEAIIWFDKDIYFAFGSSNPSNLHYSFLGNWGYSDSWLDGVSTQSYYISSNNNPGFYNFSKVTLKDGSGHTTTYNPFQLAKLGINTSIFFSDGKYLPPSIKLSTLKTVDSLSLTLSSSNLHLGENSISFKLFYNSDIVSLNSIGYPSSTSHAEIKSLKLADEFAELNISSSFNIDDPLVDFLNLEFSLSSPSTDFSYFVQDLKINNETVQNYYANSNAGLARIDGRAKAGYSLQAAPEVPLTIPVDKLVYQWRADGLALPGQSGNSLLLTANEVGKKISLLISYTNEVGITQKFLSDVTTSVRDYNEAPEAKAGTSATQEDIGLSGNLDALDAEGNILNYIKVADPIHGAVSINARTGAYTYTPAGNYNGSDSFTFKVNDGTVDSAVATVSITVAAVNDAPVGTTATATTDEDTVATGTLAGTDLDGNTLTFAKVADPSHGTVSINATTGAYTYTPAGNYNGSDSFTFKVNDGTVDSAVATVPITVAAVNDAPVGTTATITTDEDTPATGTLAGTDLDGNTLTFAKVADPSHGTVSINATTGAYTYTPAGDYNGSDSFTFKVNDGTVDSAVATVSITVKPTSYDISVKANSWRGAPLAGVKFSETGNSLSDSSGDLYVANVEDSYGAQDGQMVLTPNLNPPSSASNASVTLTDVLAALKIYLGKSLPDAYASPYSYIAADFDGNGSVNLTDVLSLLKFYLGKTTTAAPTWVFVDAADVIGAGKTASILRAGSDSLPIDATHTQPHAIDQDFSKDSSIELVGVLRGDVDGSWTAGS